MCGDSSGMYMLEPLTTRLHFSSSHHDRDHDDALPRFDHIVMVVEQNRSYDEILGEPSVPIGFWPIIGPVTQDRAPFLNWLARNGASLTHASANSGPDMLQVISGLTSPLRTAPATGPAL